MSDQPKIAASESVCAGVTHTRRCGVTKIVKTQIGNLRLLSAPQDSAQTGSLTEYPSNSCLINFIKANSSVKNRR